jgi:SAM-dependent methyltransferase
MVDWHGRLEREWPFLRQQFELGNVHRVLDLGCGTGGHSIFFARQGLEVVGADPSPSLLLQAANNAAGMGNVRFVAAGFGELRQKIGGAFDVVVCLGNSLPHILTQTALQETIEDVSSVLRPGGLFIVQQLNYNRILRSHQRFLGVSSGQKDGREVLFFRFYDFGEELLTFNLVTFNHHLDGWGFVTFNTPLRPILLSEVSEVLHNAGFTAEYWGDYAGNPFDVVKSNDLIFVATRQTSP